MSDTSDLVARDNRCEGTEPASPSVTLIDLTAPEDTPDLLIVPAASDVPRPEQGSRAGRAAQRAWVWAAMVAVVAAGALLRLHGLDRVGFNTDEAVYAGQAASIAHVKLYTPFFPIYRAHPLLFQALLSIVYHFHLTDFTARFVSVLFGLGTVLLCYLLGATLYGRRAGVATAAIVALMPYHVVTSRQALLDGPETFFATLALYTIVRYARSHHRLWLGATGAALGLTFLAKETGIILVAALVIFLAVSPDVPVRVRDLVAGAAVFGAVVIVYPLSLAAGGAARTGGSFFAWQVLRRPNHGFFFYFTTALPAIGLLVLVAAAAGLVWLWRRRSWRETLLLSWFLVPFVFFTCWPVKGYQYVLPAAPAVAALAGRTLARLPWGRAAGRLRRTGSAVAVAAVAVSLVVASWSAIRPTAGDSLLAGTGGVPGGREAGTWVRTNLPPGVGLLALGPSMANILQFYGNHEVWGLSVSTNPLHRNPVYRPLSNPDLAIRRGDVSYLVWDTYSAHRSPRFAAQLLRYVTKFHGRVVHSELGVRARSRSPVIIIYAVRP